MAPRRKASIASSKPLDYNPRDLCHPEVEAVEAACEEDDETMEKQDLENGSEFSPSQNSSQETDLTSSQSTVHNNDSEDAESQWTCSQSSQQSYYEEDDAGGE
ncbi:hypothetical protein BYT27DRAFT_7338043 [Phlegmacium glaucopus]|nr:hypothetical protein BYT27DRAFT_7338043 [Phlegmacium glaucopus]